MYETPIFKTLCQKLYRNALCGIGMSPSFPYAGILPERSGCVVAVIIIIGSTTL
jgi:hypothetical protein